MYDFFAKKLFVIKIIQGSQHDFIFNAVMGWETNSMFGPWNCNKCCCNKIWAELFRIRNIEFTNLFIGSFNVDFFLYFTYLNFLFLVYLRWPWAWHHILNKSSGDRTAYWRCPRTIKYSSWGSYASAYYRANAKWFRSI